MGSFFWYVETIDHMLDELSLPYEVPSTDAAGSINHESEV